MATVVANGRSFHVQELAPRGAAASAVSSDEAQAGKTPNPGPGNTAQPGAAQTDTAQTDAAQTGAAQTDAAQTDTAQLDSSQLDSSQLDSSQLDTAQLDTAQVDTAQVDTAQLDSAQAASARKDTGRHAAPPTVLVHGLLLDNLASWYFGVAPLLSRELARHLYMYDLRGHGKSEHAAAGFDVATQATDLLALLDIWSPTQPVDLVGHSYGGLIALHLARTHPTRIRRLALVDVPLPPSRLERVRDVISGGQQAILDAIPANLRANLTGGTRRAARTLRSLTRLLSNSTLIADLKAEGDLTDDELRALSMPVALIYGADSSCKPTGERLAALLDDARLTLLDGGHYLPVEKPAELAATLGAFLRG